MRSMARRVLLLAIALTGCLASNPSGATPDPFCPKGWKFDIAASGDCSPPTGYTALVWAELGGSGVYGFVRRAPGYLRCKANELAEPCDARMIGATPVDAYLANDVIDTTIRAGAVPVASTVSTSQGVYKLRLDPDQYRITGIDPSDGTRFWSANLQVISQALAACAIDVYPP